MCQFDNYSEIWVPHGMSASEVDAYVRQCRARGRHIVIYRSGREALTEVTSALLQVNRNIVCNGDDACAL